MAYNIVSEQEEYLELLSESALLYQSPHKVQLAADQIREAFLFFLLTNPQIRFAISRQPAGKAATKLRWFSFRSEVEKILNNTYIEPRYFSYQVREQLYKTNKVCAICQNQIHTFEDSTVDHIEPYVKGGKTILSNAQLAHRSCNARKYSHTEI